jgi:hypothetical protein
LTGVCYRLATEYVTRKLTEEWYQYHYPIECGGNYKAHKLRQELCSISQVLVLMWPWRFRSCLTHGSYG